jgi:cystathionine beta-lyase/cystathionine gamma-synthase
MERTDYVRTLDTLCPRIGIGERDGQPLEAPLVQSTTFCRSGLASAVEHAYSRVSNPTVTALEAGLGTLEDAPPAVCYASGLAAETGLFLGLLRAGDHVVCGRAVYGGTTRLLQQVLRGLGVEVTFADTTQAAAVKGALRTSTRLVFIETPANPTLEVTDIAAVAGLAHDAGALLAVDNTFMTPVLQQPLALGADLSVYSTTKFIEGHSAAVGGAIVGCDLALLEHLRFVRKSTGGIQTPFNAWLTLQGLKTLPLRIRRQSATAARVAAWLAERDDVQRVRYPGLASSPQRALADRQHAGHHGAVVSFELSSRRAAAFQANVRLCRLVEHVGGAETLLTHPASMTHGDVPPEQRRAAGIADGLVRLSVGLEDPRDIIDDLEQALAAAGDTRPEGEEGQACALRA